MELTRYTDYSLRILLYLALHENDCVTIDEVASIYGISRHHVAKAVHHLGRMGVIRTERGKGGGMYLAARPEDINIGRLVRRTEPHMNLLECFDVELNTCPLVHACTLKGVLKQAKLAFLEVLDKYTLADMLGNRKKTALALEEGQPQPL